MKKEGLDRGALYLRWVRGIAKHVRGLNEKLTPIIWDDMLRHWDAATLKVGKMRPLTNEWMD